MRTLNPWLQLLFFTVLVCDVSPAFTALARDDYITDYATAVVER